MTRTPLSIAPVLLLLGCTSGPALTINLTGVPSDTQEVDVYRQLDGSPVEGVRAFPLTAADPPRIALDLPAGLVGMARLDIDAIRRDSATTQCTLASGTRVVALTNHDVATTVDLTALAPPRCGTINPDLATPDMVTLDLSRSDLSCVPQCGVNVCNMSNGCPGGTCTCASPKVCDTRANVCGDCIPQDVNPMCVACNPDIAFDKSQNSGSQTCTGARVWSACSVNFKSVGFNAGDAGFWYSQAPGVVTMNGAAGANAHHVTSSVVDAQMIEGNTDVVGRALPTGSYTMNFLGTYTSSSVGQFKLAYSIYGGDSGQDVVSPMAVTHSISPPPGISFTLPFNTTLRFASNGACDRLITRVRITGISGVIDTVSLQRITISPQ